MQGACDTVNALGLSPTVELSKGTVQGLHCLSALERPYLSFRSIPYAAPPVGHLRFRVSLIYFLYSGQTLRKLIEYDFDVIHFLTLKGLGITYLLGVLIYETVIQMI